jgi:hypothetical protein
LGGPLSKLCVTPPFSIIFRCQIENQVSDYRLLGASSYCIKLMFLQTEMDYFLRKSLSKFLMDATDINKHDVDIFINGTGKNMRPT